MEYELKPSLDASYYDATRKAYVEHHLDTTT